MTKLSLLGAAAILSSALAGPAMAQQVISNPGYCAQFYPNANCQNTGPGNPYTGNYQRRAYHNSYNSYNRWDGDRNNSGFWPGGVAAGATVGAAGAVIGAARSEARPMPAKTASYACRAPGSAARTAAGTSANDLTRR